MSMTQRAQEPTELVRIVAEAISARLRRRESDSTTPAEVQASIGGEVVTPAGHYKVTACHVETESETPIALVVIVLLGLATVLLVRSMSKRIRRLPASFDPPEDAERDTDDRRS